MDAKNLTLPDTLFQVLIWIIVTILVLIAVFLFAAVYRRIVQAGKYRKLDRFRSEFGPPLREAIDRGAVMEIPKGYAFRPASLRWMALEDVLFDLGDTAGYRSPVNELFLRLGYVAHYEKALRKRNVIDKSSAVDKLGRMRCPASTGHLLPLLSVRNGEIATITVRALGNIGSPEGLEGILGRMDDLLANGLATRKTLETSLLNFGRAAIPSIVASAESGGTSISRASLLEVLSRLSAKEGVPAAMRFLDDPDPEIRSKALKLCGIQGTETTDAGRARVALLLDDPVWFVRLQAAKTLGAVGGPGTVDSLGARLTDPNWQVRNAVATALTRFGNTAIPVFLAVLESTDRYAKESVCEEIEKTGFVDLLLENMELREGEVFESSKRILTVMAALNYRTPHVERLETLAPGPVRQDIESMISPELPA